MGEDFDNPFDIRLRNGSLKKMSSLLDSAIFPGNQGGPLEHVIAAKAVAFGEALSEDFLFYILQVKKNAQVMADEFVKRDYKVVSGSTVNHCILLDLRNKNITGKEAERVLGISNITVNKNMVPFDDQSPFVTSGIRLGTAAITTRGFKEAETKVLGNLICDVLDDIDDESKIESVREKVLNLTSQYPVYSANKKAVA